MIKESEMQLLLTFDNKGVIDFPVNYNYYIQAAIFALLADEDSEYAALLHDTAYGGKAKYKMFIFGGLKGRNHFHDKKLYFEGDIMLEIRSASDEFIHVLAESVLREGKMRIGRHTLEIKEVEGLDYRIDESLIKIRTLTPIIAKEQTEDKKTIYYSPQDVRFIRRVREAFESKYEACCETKPQSSIDILPVKGGKKIVTKYKDTWITAYHGIFQLYGEPEHLQFMYDVGLGAKTSQGFGMFDVID